ncbi:hypothetical protein Ahy_A08g037552 isoform B [Arachis hypogaea]|uniref:Homeobox domain-containing protein n=2 Tax=Arachis hypogaea TaxID=3818 RepID=A0A445BR75_ARAHY|nr:hypothetical protein Ahy_A08g037552 isoform B [Arachis hypogaea]
MSALPHTKFSKSIEMYPNQAFSSGSYAEMLSGNPLLSHNYNNNGSVGAPNMVDPSCNSFVGGEQNVHGQGLSLSLGTSVPSFQYQYDGTTAAAECMVSLSSGGFHESAKREGLYNSNNSDPCIQGSFSNGVLNSHYLKAAQELLDEIVGVRKALLKQPGMEKQEKFNNGIDGGSKDSDGKCNSQSLQNNVKPPNELSAEERQSLLEKKTKLLTLLDEVDKKYRQYCHQMQIVVSSFDMVAGCGAAEPYTWLALRTISRHFRSLRDAISGQIQVIQRCLGEQEGIPRLRYVDQQLRQQKALQQLGVMRQAWRPQRGLPETSVSILRAWLFEHFLHPYPKDSEKIMLARQTGLTRNQVANWFINARVRLWKPMVEEMYKEEFGDSDNISCNIPSEGIVKRKRDDAEASDNKGEDDSQDNLVTIADSVQQEGHFHKHTSCSVDENNNNGVYSCGSIMGCSTSPAAYDFAELGNFTSTMGGHVSLALELRNCERDGFGGMSDNDGIHKKRRNHNQGLASSSSSSSPETDHLLDYHFTDSGKQQHRFSSNPHLLHEFVV